MEAEMVTVAPFLIACFVALTSFLIYEKYVCAFSTLVALGIYLFFFQYDWIEWWKDRPWEIVKYLSVYFLIGTAYCIVKWVSFVMNTREKNREQRKLFFDAINFQTHDYRDIPKLTREEQQKKWEEYLEHYTYTDVFGVNRNIRKPTVYENQARIVSWIIYWPPSMFWFILNDPLRRIGNAIYRMIGNLLSELTDWVWGKDD